MKENKNSISSSDDNNNNNNNIIIIIIIIIILLNLFVNCRTELCSFFSLWFSLTEGKIYSNDYVHLTNGR